ncbi:MAG TPA: hypothetical protein VGN90_14960 [Pyrinomonadaceae bacterium]|nr:hypothetical protein [Pyrinomonadaceae bacterium]
MSIPDPVALQRFRYQQGQSLLSDDRRDQVAVEAQLRWWHNRALHNAFGVADGMRVQLQTGNVLVEPGVAYDYRGRELILQKPRTLALPPASKAPSASWVLLARFKETSEYPKRSDFDRGCQASSFLESPEFLWKVKGEWSPADGVPLASVVQDAKGISETPGFVQRREHGQARHRVVTGETLPGNTGWESWTERFPQGNRQQVGFQVKIDTRQSGFTQTPCYFGWVQRVPPNPPGPQSILVPFSHIVAEKPDSFTFRIWLPPLFMLGSEVNTMHALNRVPAKKSGETRELTILDATLRFYVSWLAIEEELGLASTHQVEELHKGVLL